MSEIQRDYFTKENIHDILNLTNELQLSIYRKPPHADQANVGVFVLSF